MNPCNHPTAVEIACVTGLTWHTGADRGRGTLNINLFGHNEVLRDVWHLLQKVKRVHVTLDTFIFYVDKTRFPGAAHSCIPRHLHQRFPTKRERQGDPVYHILWTPPYPGYLRDSEPLVQIARSLWTIEQNLKQLSLS